MADSVEQQIQQLYAIRRDTPLGSATNAFVGRVAVVLAREIDRLRAEVEGLKPQSRKKGAKRNERQACIT